MKKIVFKTEDLKRALTNIDMLIKNNVDLLSRTIMISISPVEQQAQIKVHTNGVGVCQTIPVECTGEEKHEFIIEHKMLLQAARNSPEEVALEIKNKNILSTHILGGELEFENYKLKREHFDIPIDIPPIETSLYTEMDSNIIIRFLHDASKVMVLASRPEDKKVKVSAGRGTCNFLSSLTGINTLLPDMILRQIDLQLLKGLIDVHESVSYMVTEEHQIFITPDKFQCVIPIVKMNTQDVIRVLDTLEACAVYKVDSTTYANVLELMKGLIDTTGLTFVYVRDKKLFLSTTTSTNRKAEFPVGEHHSGEHTFSLKVPTGTLNALTSLIKSNKEFFLSIDLKNRISIIVDNITIVLGSIL